MRSFPGALLDRTIFLSGIPDEDTARNRLKADLPRLVRRATMLNRAIFCAVIGSIAVIVLVFVAFISAFLQIQHEREVAIVLMVALTAFTVSLVDFAREVRIALSEYDHYGKRASLLTEPIGSFEGTSTNRRNSADQRFHSPYSLPCLNWGISTIGLRAAAVLAFHHLCNFLMIDRQ
jgi:hypothetical protein